MENKKRLIKMCDATAVYNGIALYMAENAYLNDTALDVLKMVAGWLNDAPTVDAVEVAEYNAVIEKLENLLCHATGGKYSKAGYAWEDMERMVTDYIEECCEEAVAEEVVHAYWTGSSFSPMTEEYEECCSHCCAWSSEYGKPYCPNCGAKMDRGEET